MGRKLRIGLIGMGRIGKLHGSNIQNLVKDAEIVLAADPYLNDQTLEWAQGVGIPRCTKDVEEIFSSPDVDVVFICSSTDTHAEYIIRAAKAGKDIFCEKPIATDLGQIREATESVSKLGV